MRKKVPVTQLLQSVAQALRIVKLLQAESPLGVAELARVLDSSPSTVHRLLATLRDADFVVQLQAGGKYALGPAMRPQNSVVEHVIEVGGPHMVALRDRTAETVHLAVVRGTETHFVAAYESPHIMRVTSRIGKSLPAHTTAAGKLLLALRSDAEIHELYPDERLPEGAPGSVLTRTVLLDELHRVRADDFGRNLAESEVGVAALAVPVRSPTGEVLCSLTLTGPDAQYNPEHTAELSPRETELLHFLRRTAGLIESELAATAAAPGH